MLFIITSSFTSLLWGQQQTLHCTNIFTPFDHHFTLCWTQRTGFLCPLWFPFLYFLWGIAFRRICQSSNPSRHLGHQHGRRNKQQSIQTHCLRMSITMHGHFSDVLQQWGWYRSWIFAGKRKTNGTGHCGLVHLSPKQQSIQCLHPPNHRHEIVG